MLKQCLVGFDSVSTFFIFLLTGITTALPVMYMLAGAWMGVPVVATEFASLIGSCLLISSAYVSLFSRKQASRLAVVGILGIGSFWCIEPIKALHSGAVSIIMVGLLGLVWLAIAATLSATVKGIRATEHNQVGNPFRKVVLSISTVLLFVSIVGIEWQHKANERTPSRYEIPEGYVGWVEIQYGISGTPAIPLKNKQLVFAVPASGLLKTSSSQQFGEAHDQYCYCVKDSCRELPNTGWGKGGMIWDESSGTFEETGKPEIRLEHFFVGKESEYKKMQDLSSMQKGIVPGDMKAILSSSH